jgi:hypothetical protein
MTTQTLQRMSDAAYDPIKPAVWIIMQKGQRSVPEWTTRGTHIWAFPSCDPLRNADHLRVWPLSQNVQSPRAKTI